MQPAISQILKKSCFSVLKFFKIFSLCTLVHIYALHLTGEFFDKQLPLKPWICSHFYVYQGH